MGRSMGLALKINIAGSASVQFNVFFMTKNKSTHKPGHVKLVKILATFMTKS